MPGTVTSNPSMDDVMKKMDDLMIMMDSMMGGNDYRCTFTGAWDRQMPGMSSSVHAMSGTMDSMMMMMDNMMLMMDNMMSMPH